MPRGVKAGLDDISPKEAKVILDKLVRYSVVSREQVTRVRQEIDSERQQLLARLEDLGGVPGAAIGALAGVAETAKAAVVASAPAVVKAAKRVLNLTDEQRASRKLQGTYLALIRQFSESKRGQYSKTAKEKGREAAIKEMLDAGAISPQDRAAAKGGQQGSAKKRGGSRKKKR